MNPETRVAVCCYEGDAHQVIEMMALYHHHECPVTVLSPDDSRVQIPGIDCQFGGKRCYIGWDGVERMKAHLRILLTYPEEFFLIHDADSIILDPQIPAYVYAEPATVWSNTIGNGNPDQIPGFPAFVPHLAFQPPWFLHRTTIERLLAVGDDVPPNHYLPFIDYWMVEATIRAGLPYKSFELCASMPISSDPPSAQAALASAGRGGLVVVHSVKGIAHAQPLVDARKKFLSTQPIHRPVQRRRSQLPTQGPRA